jgi:hypothetical protein
MNPTDLHVTAWTPSKLTGIRANVWRIPALRTVLVVALLCSITARPGWAQRPVAQSDPLLTVNSMADPGPDYRPDYPTIGLIGSDGAELIVAASALFSTRTLDVTLYTNTSCDAAGHGAGEQLIGRATLTKDDFGLQRNRLFTFPVAVPPGSLLTATATVVIMPTPGERISVTSEFSPCRVVAGVINQHLTLLATTTTYDPALGTGLFTITATFQNRSGAPLTDLFFKVKTLTNNNRLMDAFRGSGDPAGVGAVQLGPRQVDPGASFTIDFRIILTERKPFTFLVDTYGVSSTGYTVTAAGAAETGFGYTADRAALEAGEFEMHWVYLPLIQQ